MLDGRLALSRRLGRGGSSRAYLAHDAGAGRDVALKILDIGKMQDWKQLELFKRQHQVLSNLDVDGVPDAYGMFEAEMVNGVQWCFEQELISGDTLQAELDAGRRFSEADAREILAKLLDILEALHALSPPLIHRDIKPSNLIHTPSGDVVLIDFDTATGDFEDPFKRDATMVGTAGYVPLEQLSGQSVPASDLYAAGMTVVALLSRRPVTDLPIEGGRVRFEDAIEVSDILRYVLTRLLAPAVEERLQSAEAVRTALSAPIVPVASAGALVPLGESQVMTPAELSALNWITDRHLAWPTEASASSQFSATFSPICVCAPPTVFPDHWDRGGTWSPWRGNEGPEWLEVIFSEALPPARALRIFETHCPGAITRVEVVGQTGVAQDIYRGEPVVAPHEARVLEIALEPPRAVARAIIHLDTSAVPGFNEIDSVALVAVEPVHAEPVNWGPKRQKGFWTMIFVVVSTVLGLILWGALSKDAFRGALEEQPSVAEGVPGAVAKAWPTSRDALSALPVAWAEQVRTFSSQYGDTLWSTRQAFGSPNVWPEFGDKTEAWAPGRESAGFEYAVFGFPDAPPTAAILIVESFGPGALVAVDDASDPEHVVGLWTRGEANVVSDSKHVLRIDLASPRPLSALRIVLDTRRVEGFNEIDAIGLLPSGL